MTTGSVTAPNNAGALLQKGQILSLTGQALVQWVGDNGQQQGPISMSTGQALGPFTKDVSLIINPSVGTVTYSMSSSTQVITATIGIEDFVYRIKTNNVSANAQISLPANSMILAIVINETAGNPISGGLNIGTTSGASNVLALPVAANSTSGVNNSSLNNAVFLTAASLFLSAGSAWNGASINVSVSYINI